MGSTVRGATPADAAAVREIVRGHGGKRCDKVFALDL